MPAKNEFTAAEQQQVSIATPGLFAQSQAFNVDFEIFRAKEYSFPLPVGKATLLNNHVLRISTSKGDAVKAMLEGYVRLSRKSESMGNVIVVRHDCGLETVVCQQCREPGEGRTACGCRTDDRHRKALRRVKLIATSLSW